MIRKIVIAIALIATLGLYGQDGSVSPYSYFGIGEIRAAGTVENQMMGGIGVFADSIHVNLKNPASLSKLGIQIGEDFGITTYAAGVSRKELRLKTFSEQESNSITNLDYLALAFSIKKGWGLSFGVMPYTSVGYNLVAETTNANNRPVTNQFTGEGGLNRVFLSMGYEFAKDLSVGATANFNFGIIENDRLQSVEDVQFATLDKRISKINGMDFNYALYYTPRIKNNQQVFASVRINTQANLVSKNTQQVGSFSRVSGSNIEVIDVNLDELGLRNTELKMPTTATLGLGYGENRKWFLGAEYSFQGLSSFTNEFLSIANLKYQDASTLALGGFFIPDYTSFTGYLNRVTYRAGVRFEKTGMILNDKEINNFGITFGLGLPLGSNYSNLNIGFELGRRGTSAANLVEESYLKVNVGLSLNDNWFRKRKIY